MAKKIGIPNKILWIKKNSGSSKRFVSVSLTEDVKNMLLNGLTPIEDKPQLGSFLMTKFPLEGEGDNKFAYYPVRMLYRSEAERILNSIIHERFLPSYDQMEYMYNAIEDLVGETIDWYLKSTMSTEALIQSVDDVTRSDTLTNLPNSVKLETIGQVLACMELFPKNSPEWQKYLDVAVMIGEQIVDSTKSDVVIEVADYV